MTKKLTLLALPLLCAAVLIGCGHRLEPGGAYAPAAFTTLTNSGGEVTTNAVALSQPDFQFFVVESAFDLAYSGVDAAFKFERSNRQLLWQVSPNIKHTLDQVRPQALVVVQQYAAARKVYMANPVPANLTVLEQVLAKMKQLYATATAVLPQKTP